MVFDAKDERERNMISMTAALWSTFLNKEFVYDLERDIKLEPRQAARMISLYEAVKRGEDPET